MVTKLSSYYNSGGHVIYTVRVNIITGNYTLTVVVIVLPTA